VMYTSGGGFAGDYFRCADIALRGTPAADAMPGSADAMPGDFADAMPGGFADAATGGADAAMTGGNSSGASGGCQIASGGAGGATGALVLAASFLALALRRRKAASSARR
ncbi:MAG TPA: hypothetical protein VFG83_04750, partial [Kofleriaceae bacterium]|nr:hypothetical protein [Kofleriaceae bacterium]